MYNAEEDFMKTWNRDENQSIHFIKGLDFQKLDTSKPSMLIVDDLILSDKNKEIAEIFILGRIIKIFLYSILLRIRFQIVLSSD